MGLTLSLIPPPLLPPPAVAVLLASSSCGPDPIPDPALLLYHVPPCSSTAPQPLYACVCCPVWLLLRLLRLRGPPRSSRGSKSSVSMPASYSSHEQVRGAHQSACPRPTAVMSRLGGNISQHARVLQQSAMSRLGGHISQYARVLQQSAMSRLEGHLSHEQVRGAHQPCPSGA